MYVYRQFIINFVSIYMPTHAISTHLSIDLMILCRRQPSAVFTKLGQLQA
jgi:hypothetical protein